MYVRRLAHEKRVISTYCSPDQLYTVTSQIIHNDFMLLPCSAHNWTVITVLYVLQTSRKITLFAYFN